MSLRFAQPRSVGALLIVCLVAAPAARAGFTDVAPAVLGANHSSRSASLADYDNDGDLDLFFQGSTGSQRLYRNDLNLGAGLDFTDVSGLLPPGLASSWSAAWADYNGDGRVDAFMGSTNAGTRSGTVLTNLGPLGFFNQSDAIGLDDPGFHQNVAWADIDSDNDLDLILAMEGPTFKHEIYLQDDTGEFSPVGALAGFQDDPGIKAYGMAIGDTDGDGDLDVYLSTCQFGGNIRNHFYENQLAETGELRFEDIADENGTQFFDNSYGAEFLDFDDDGDLDLFMVGADSEPSKIFRNDGGNQFTDVDQLTGTPLLSDTSGDLNGAKAVDYDNDGDLDLFFHDHIAANGKNAARKLYRNDGDWTFTDVTASEGLAALNEGSFDSPWGDIDRDGDMDLIGTTDGLSNERVFLNDADGNGNHWLQVELAGPSSNTTGLGATLYATTDKGTPDERTLRREANTNAGTFNQSDLPVHFGLGEADVIDELRIVWPDGTVQVLAGVAVDQYLAVAQADFLAGDFNGDGVVDAGDYTVWRDQEGQSGIGLAADANGDATVDGDDYALWEASFGATVGGAAGVPEPTAAVLMALACLTRAAGRRRGASR